MTSGWWKIDSDSSQPESCSVPRPPLPGSLPVSADIWSRNSVPVVVTVKVTQCESGTWAAPKNTAGLPKFVRPCARPFGQAPQHRPGPSAARRRWGLGHRSERKVGGLRSEGHQHEILRSDSNRGRAVPFVVDPVDGYAAGRWGQADVPNEGAGQELHAVR